MQMSSSSIRSSAAIDHVPHQGQTALIEYNSYKTAALYGERLFVATDTASPQIPSAQIGRFAFVAPRNRTTDAEIARDR
jgi:hypothetical protein